MKYLLILLTSTLCGCMSHRYEYFSHTLCRPTNEVQAIPRIKATGENTAQIPLLFSHVKRGAPYHLELSFISETEPSESITLTKVSLKNTEGETHQLLSKETKIRSFHKRKYNFSSKEHGKYSRDIFESFWTSFNLPLKFINRQYCTIEVEYSVDEKGYTKKWKIGTNLQKKSENIISYMMNY